MSHNEWGGIFGDLGEIEGANMVLTEDGVDCTFIGDGSPRRVLIEYPELIAIKYQVPPHLAFRGTNAVRGIVDWKMSADGRGFAPSNVVGEKQQPLLWISPQEAGALVDSAFQRGLIDPAALQQISNHCAKLAGQIRR